MLKFRNILISCLVLLVPGTVFAEKEQDAEYLSCLHRELMKAENTLTVGELRELCREQVAQKLEILEPLAEDSVQASLLANMDMPVFADSSLTRRLRWEKEARDNPFALIAHRPTYFLPWVYNRQPNQNAFDGAGELNNVEAQFQFSFKVPILKRLTIPLLSDLLGDRGNLSIAYTNRSFWQVYNKKLSAPFRETNHEPELLLSFFNDNEFLGFRNVANMLILNHQSNGKDLPTSRSWNRLMADFIFERNNMGISFKTWYRLSEELKNSPTDTEGDDNPDILDYLGHFELTTVLDHNNYTYSLMIRDPVTTHGKGAFEFGWSFPINDRLRGFVKYFNGYGESLIDYNVRNKTIGLGFQLTDWL